MLIPREYVYQFQETDRLDTLPFRLRLFTPTKEAFTGEISRWLQTQLKVIRDDSILGWYQILALVRDAFKKHLLHIYPPLCKLCSTEETRNTECMTYSRTPAREKRGIGSFTKPALRQKLWRDFSTFQEEIFTWKYLAGRFYISLYPPRNAWLFEITMKSSCSSGWNYFLISGSWYRYRIPRVLYKIIPICKLNANDIRWLTGGWQ